MLRWQACAITPALVTRDLNNTADEPPQCPLPLSSGQSVVFFVFPPSLLTQNRQDIVGVHSHTEITTGISWSTVQPAQEERKGGDLTNTYFKDSLEKYLWFSTIRCQSGERWWLVLLLVLAKRGGKGNKKEAETHHPASLVPTPTKSSWRSNGGKTFHLLSPRLL